MLLSNPAWLASGETIVLLEPRRLAARAAATRMAAILGEPVGKTVGYRVRFDQRVGPETRVEVVTEGVLARRLRDDPGLEGVAALVFDEFHERSLDADLSLALAVDARATLRPDLRIVVMSATLGDVGARVANLLGASGGEERPEESPDPKRGDARSDSGASENSGSAPLVRSLGRSFPVATHYLGAPGRGFGELEAATVAAIVRALSENPEGDVLAFLPGAAEINRVISKLRESRACPPGVDAVPLYGALSQEDQATALRPAPPGRRRVVVSTPIAESSLTIPGVRCVVDSGLRKSPTFDARKGMTRLRVSRVSRASADQRRGRAGRVAPGTCYRMWSESANDALSPDTAPEIREADLAPLALETAAWGALDPATDLPWLDPPPAGRLDAARDLLVRLGALDREKPHRVTEMGRLMLRLPLHPRLARMVLWGAARGPESARLACQLAAVLGDRDILRGRDAPVDVRARLGALWDAHAARGIRDDGGSDATPRGGAEGSTPPSSAVFGVAETENAGEGNPSPSRKKKNKPSPGSSAAPVRVPIGTKVTSGGKKRNKNMRGAPRGGKPAGGGALAAAKAARASRSGGGGGTAGLDGASSSFGGYEGAEVDRAAAREAGKVARQLMRELAGLAARSRSTDDSSASAGAPRFFAPGVGEGDPAGPVFPFLLGEGVDEVGALLATAYPDRVAIRRGRSGAHVLSGDNGAATVPTSDPLSREPVLAVAELAGDAFAGASGARNDRISVAAPVPASALEPEGCLARDLCETVDVIAWASASKAVVCRRQTRVGSATLREAPFAPEDPDATTPAMLEGVRAMGAEDALGWSARTEQWRRRCEWLRVHANRDDLPDLSLESLNATLEEWLAPALAGVTSKSALRALDGDGMLRSLLTYEQQKVVDEACPTHVTVPSGSKLPIEYDAPGGTPVLRARLQELFGMSSSPTVGSKSGGKRVALEVHLLSPAGRPVQVTTDLASFWAEAYHDVAKEMRGRYPKHYWPEDPTTAEATNRAKPRKKGK